MLVNFLDAIVEIGKVTKHKSNEFSILHYISNGYLDILVEFNPKFESQLLQISSLGNEDENGYFVVGIENEKRRPYKIDISSINLNQLLVCLQNKSGEVKLVTATNGINDTIKYVFLDKPVKSFDNNDLFRNPIELSEISNNASLGLEFNVLELLFDLKQIKKIPSPTRKPNTKGIVNHTKKARTIKDIGLWIARKEIKKNPSITKKELGFHVHIFLTSKLPKIIENQSKLRIKGHLTIPDPDTIRKWKELNQLFQK